MILTEIHPFCRHIPISILVGSKSLAVKITNEILSCAAAERTAGIDIAYQHPLFFSGTLHGEFKQVRTFPYTILRSKAFAKSAVQSPVLQIRRAEYQHLVVKSMGEEQIPFSGSCVPEHIRVASLTFKSDYRIAGIYLKRHSVVFTVGKTLYLACSRRSI